MRFSAYAISIGVAAILSGAPAARAQQPAGVTSRSGSASHPSQSDATGLPTAAAYSRPTASERFAAFGREAIGPYTIIKTVAVAGVLQAQNSPPDWGQGAKGFGDRVGSEYGRFLAETGSRYLIAAAFGQDAKYYRCACTGFGHRLGHALKASFTARAGDDGHYVFSPAPIAAPYVGGFTELAWYPARYGWKDGIRFGSYGVLYSLGGNIAREFISAKF
jgi:hypothetical protein